MPIIQYFELEDAMDSYDDGFAEWYLDRTTGSVRMVSLDFDAADDAEYEVEEVRNDPSRYLEIPRFEPRDEFDAMATFAEALADDDIRDRFAIALDGRRGVFRRFRNVLADYPDLRDRWFEHQRRHRAARMRVWLEREGIDAELRMPEPAKKAAPEPRARPPGVDLVDVLLLGAPNGKTELIHGRVRRILPCADEDRSSAAFRRLARQICEAQGVGWRRRFVEGKTRFELERFRLAQHADRVVLEVEVSPETWRAFY